MECEFMHSNQAKVSQEEFIRLFPIIGPTGIAKEFGVSVENVYRRRRYIEGKLDITLRAPGRLQNTLQAEHVRKNITLKNGTIIVFSDAHYWQDISTAHLALLQQCKKLKPDIVVANGDMLDGASISRHPPISWEGTPSVSDELEYNKMRLGEIVKASPKAKHYWPLGNHDMRFEAKLAREVKEYAGVSGFHLKDHFPQWIPCMAIWVNDEVVIKHRGVGGVHSRWRNAIQTGKTMVTGHTHQMGCTPFTDYNGTRFGIESGTLAEPNGAQFEYAEDSPKNWISGFCVLTFVDGALMLPEFARTISTGKYEFRGKVHEVSL